MFSLAWIVLLFVIVAIGYLVLRPRHNQHNAASPYGALMGYFYFMIAASVITMTVGMVYFVKVAIGQAFDGGEISNDLTLASVLLGTGLVICILHVYGRRAVQKREEEATTNIRRIYLFFMLGIYSLTGLISLPLAIYQTIRYFTVEPDYGYYHPQAPSTELAVAIVFVPLWAYFMFRVLQEIRQRNRGDTSDLPSPQE